MIAYKIQLWYVIQDKIRDRIHSETKFSPRQKPVQDKIQSEKKSEKKIFLSEKKFYQKKNCLRHCLRFPVCKVSCLGQIDAYHQ